MFLTISTTHRPATEIGHVLRKNPASVRSVQLSFGTAHVFYPEATDERCTVALYVDVDPVELMRKGRRKDVSLPLAQYVNDRPYAASSLLSSAIAKLFGSAMSGTSDARPELAETAIPLEVHVPALPARGGAALVASLFEPLGYDVDAEPLPLDTMFPDWGNSFYVDLTLRGNHMVAALLTHLYVLLPVLDDDKHYWVSDAEIDKLLRRGGDWLDDHPERDLIVRRYMRHRTRLTREALTRLSDTDSDDPDRAAEEHDREEQQIENPLSLHTRRLQAVVEALAKVNARRVLDLGCGEGRLVELLLRDSRIEEVVGVDVSVRALEVAARRLRLERLPKRQRGRVQLLHSSLTYRDRRLEGCDGAAAVEVIEHLDRPRLSAFERNVFGYARPRTVVITTPNVEYNVRFEGLPAGRLRHRDHRFEWTRDEFRSWAGSVGDEHGYRTTFHDIGDVDQLVGAPTQMAVFTR